VFESYSSHFLFELNKSPLSSIISFSALILSRVVEDLRSVKVFSKSFNLLSLLYILSCYKVHIFSESIF
jgi:hypothetical protein